MKLKAIRKDGSSNLLDASSIVVMSDNEEPIAIFIQPDPSKATCFQLLRGDHDFDTYAANLGIPLTAKPTQVEDHNG